MTAVPLMLSPASTTTESVTVTGAATLILPVVSARVRVSAIIPSMPRTEPTVRVPLGAVVLIPTAALGAFTARVFV
jgi:hypothetical protein